MAAESSHLLVTFLQSIGRQDDAELYLRLFKQHPKESFALVLLEGEVLEHALGAVAEQLRYLSDLGLSATIAALPGDAQTSRSQEIAATLGHADLSTEVVQLGSSDCQAASRSALRRGATVVLDFSTRAVQDVEVGLSAFISSLNTRKVVLLRTRGGLGPHRAGLIPLSATHFLATHENGISVVNLTTDLSALATSSQLAPGELDLLRLISAMHAVSPSLLTSITSPFSLLHELFTVKGAGTLVKTGTRVERFNNYAELDQYRLVQLLNEAFGREVRREFFDVTPLAIYLDPDYRGAAILLAGANGAFLSKFAVTRKAQGEGLGRDIWEAVARDHRGIYWRARPSNPISNWYTTVADGVHRLESWHVFWKGMETEQLPALIADAVGREIDFET